MTNRLIQLLRIHQHNPAEAQLVVKKRTTAKRRTVGRVNRRLVETKERKASRSRFMASNAYVIAAKERSNHMTKGVRWRNV